VPTARSRLRARVTPQKARALFREMAVSRLGYGFPEDYCSYRADVASAAIERAGVRSHLVWVGRGARKLKAEAPTHPRGAASWEYHVAPAVRIGRELFVLDPSIFDRPVPAREWLAAVGAEDAALEPARPVSRPRGMGAWITPAGKPR